MKPEAVSAHARQFRRHALEQEARITPHPDHAEQFRLSFPEAQFKTTVIDASEGGLGLQSGVYLPKNLRVVIRISAGGGGGAQAGRELTVRGVVRRCDMLDHKPTYQAGIQFLDAQGRDERSLVELVARSGQRAGERVLSGGAGVA